MHTKPRGHGPIGTDGKIKPPDSSVAHLRSSVDTKIKPPDGIKASVARRHSREGKIKPPD
jgi:hypothetical protein